MSNPYENNQPELSVDAIDLILTEDMKAFDKSQIVNPEHKGPQQKGKGTSTEDKGSEWRLTA